MRPKDLKKNEESVVFRTAVCKLVFCNIGVVYCNYFEVVTRISGYFRVTDVKKHATGGTLGSKSFWTGLGLASRTYESVCTKSRNWISQLVLVYRLVFLQSIPHRSVPVPPCKLSCKKEHHVSYSRQYHQIHRAKHWLK
jgi:hypothetical protein